MVIKFVESTYDSFKDKLKNPFYGTLFVVWIIRNREFIYKVFFHEKLTSDERLEIIRDHFLNWNSFLSFLGTILISLGLMVLIYASLNLSRFIVEFLERKFKPWIQQLFSKTSIVSRDDYSAMEKDRDYFQKKYSEERIERVKLQRELDTLKEESNNHSKIQNALPETEEIDKKNDAEKIIEKWKRIRPSYLEDFKKLMKLNPNNLQPHEVSKIMNDIASVREFKDKGIIETIEYDGYRYYNFTELGSELKYSISQNP